MIHPGFPLGFAGAGVGSGFVRTGAGVGVSLRGRRVVRFGGFSSISRTRSSFVFIFQIWPLLPIGSMVARQYITRDKSVNQFSPVTRLPFIAFGPMAFSARHSTHASGPGAPG